MLVLSAMRGRKVHLLETFLIGERRPEVGLEGVWKTLCNRPIYGTIREAESPESLGDNLCSTCGARS